MAMIDKAGTIMGCSFIAMSAVIMLRQGGLLRTAYADWQVDRRNARIVEQQWPALSAGEHALGDGMRETMVEFTDYRCPYCRMSHDSSARLLSDDEGRRIVVRLFPRPGDPLAYAAAEAGVCAGMQGRFAQFTDEIFRTDGWERTQDWVTVARAAGVADSAAYSACISSGAARPILTRDSMFAVMVGVSGTPAFAGRKNGLHVGVLPNTELAGWFTAIRQ